MPPPHKLARPPKLNARRLSNPQSERAVGERTSCSAWILRPVPRQSYSGSLARTLLLAKALRKKSVPSRLREIAQAGKTESPGEFIVVQQILTGARLKFRASLAAGPRERDVKFTDQGEIKHRRLEPIDLVRVSRYPVCIGGLSQLLQARLPKPGVDHLAAAKVEKGNGALLRSAECFDEFRTGNPTSFANRDELEAATVAGEIDKRAAALWDLSNPECDIVCAADCSVTYVKAA